jgi:hypothetical protein
MNDREISLSAGALLYFHHGPVSLVIVFAGIFSRFELYGWWDKSIEQFLLNYYYKIGF